MNDIHMETSADRKISSIQNHHQAELKKCIEDANAWKSSEMNKMNIKIQELIEENQIALETQKKVITQETVKMNEKQKETINELKEQIRESVKNRDKLENDNSKLVKEVSELKTIKKEIKEELKDCLKSKQKTPSATKQKTPSATKQKTPSATKRKTPSATKRNTPSATKQKTPSATKQKTPSATKRKTPSATNDTRQKTKPTCEELFEKGLKNDFSNVTITIDNNTWQFPQDMVTFGNLVSYFKEFQIPISEFKTLLDKKSLRRLKKLTHPDMYRNKCGDSEENNNFMEYVTEINQLLN